MSTQIKGSGEEILEQHPKLDALIERLEDIACYWNGEDSSYIGGDGESHNEEEADVAGEAIEKVEELKKILTELGITY